MTHSESAVCVKAIETDLRDAMGYLNDVRKNMNFFNGANNNFAEGALIQACKAEARLKDVIANLKAVLNSRKERFEVRFYLRDSEAYLTYKEKFVYYADAVAFAKCEAEKHYAGNVFCVFDIKEGWNVQTVVSK
jgi:hypothetical protein